MVNAEYGKVKLSLTLHFNEYNKFRLLLDGKEPMDFGNTGKAIYYVFEREVGNHILTFESIPFEKNQLGKLRFSFLSESFQKRILNHLFAFRYDLSCFKVTYMLHIHRNAKLEIAIKTKEIRDLDAAEVAHHLRYIFIGCAFEESFNNGLTVEEVQKHLMFYYNIIKR